MANNVSQCITNVSQIMYHKSGLGGLVLDNRTNLFTRRVVRQQKLAGKAVEHPSLKVFEAQ